MPTGIYIRTKQHNRNISKARRKWIRENPEKAREHYFKMGKNSKGKIGNRINNGKGLVRWRRENPKRAKEIYSKNCKVNWENNREVMVENCRKNGRTKGFKIAWKNNRGKMLESCRRGGKASIQKQQKTNPSYIELIVRNYLDKLGIRHQDNVWFRNNGTDREADIVIPKVNLIIECDGFMHNNLRIKQIDKLKDRFFNKLGYKVLRLKSPEIRNGSFVNKLLKKMEQIKPKILLERRMV